MSTVKNGQYNEGALAGRFALRDLTNSGKFTNIINVIPYRYQVTISGSSLSVAAGSTFTVLDGLSEADLTPYNIYPKITEELTVSSGSLINSSTELVHSFSYIFQPSFVCRFGDRSTDDKMSPGDLSPKRHNFLYPK